mmetsp:Transcript_28153/g.50370  ORF Transcript_28153/g.50370 Transcript_28153/m.50370 type:complete len:264 (+) Transcript_28153:2260-3051(+)
MKIVRRAFSTPLTFPWKFKQTSPPFDLKEVPVPLVHRLSQFHDGFSFAYSVLVESLSKKDYKHLEKILEPKLYDRVKLSLAELDKSSMQLRLLNSEPAKLRMHNFKASMGVYLNRKNNMPRDRYMLISTYENLKALLKSSPMLASRIPADDSLLDEMMFYMSPDAPANMCYSVDAVFRGPAPLSAASHGVDMIYTESQEELHVVKFEIEKIFGKTQSELAKKQADGGMDSIMNLASQNSESMFAGNWVITDIDNTLGGNPYLK